MPDSPRFRILKSRVKELEKHLIPKTNLSGSYTKRQYDLIRSYRLLVHAEFESYLEDSVVHLADTAISTYKTKSRTGSVLAALMTFSPLSPQEPPASLSTKHKFDTPNSRVNRVVTQFKNFANGGNHGIKESNLIALLYPVGITEADLDTTFVNTMNSYGAARGAVAHSSSRTQQPIDPVTEVKTVARLLVELEKLDAKFLVILKQNI